MSHLSDIFYGNILEVQKVSFQFCLYQSFLYFRKNPTILIRFTIEIE